MYIVYTGERKRERERGKQIDARARVLCVCVCVCVGVGETRMKMRKMKKRKDHSRMAHVLKCINIFIKSHKNVQGVPRKEKELKK